MRPRTRNGSNNASAVPLSKSASSVASGRAAARGVVPSRRSIAATPLSLTHSARLRVASLTSRLDDVRARAPTLNPLDERMRISHASTAVLDRITSATASNASAAGAALSVSAPRVANRSISSARSWAARASSCARYRSWAATTLVTRNANNTNQSSGLATTSVLYGGRNNTSNTTNDAAAVASPSTRPPAALAPSTTRSSISATWTSLSIGRTATIPAVHNTKAVAAIATGRTLLARISPLCKRAYAPIT